MLYYMYVQFMLPNLLLVMTLYIKCMESRVNIMLNVCNKHVKTSLQGLTVPHVKKIKGYTCICSFCSEQATVKLYYPSPFSIKKYYKNLIDNDNNYQLNRQ